MSEAPFRTLDELRREFPHLKRGRNLHPVVEARLATLLQDIWPDAYAKAEPGEMPAGRSDLGFYFNDGRYAVFEIFATVSQVAQDLRHLEQSNAQARIAILPDPLLDNGAIYDEYYGKRPRDPFPALKLSDILVAGREEAAKQTLRECIEEAFASPGDDAELPERLQSRLAELALDDESRDDFGENSFTSDVARLDSRCVIIAAIPLHAISCSPTAVLMAASRMLDPDNWYDTSGDDYPPRYWPEKNFRVPRTRRSAGNALFWEDAAARTTSVPSRLVITNRAEVLFASSAGAQFVTSLVDGTGVFRLGRIIAVFWELSGLIAQLYRDIGHAGRTHLCVLLLGTMGTVLGAFADGYLDPIEEQLWSWDILHERDSTCHAANVKHCDTVDVLAMEPKKLPEFVHDFAEAISLAYNHDYPLCFDKKTGFIPDRYL